MILGFNSFQKWFIGNKDMKANICRIQSFDSIMFGCFCLRFFDFMFKGKGLTEFTDSFSQQNFKNNANIIFNYFWIKINVGMVEIPNYATTNMYPQLEHTMQFRLGDINKVKDSFIA